MGKNEPKPYFTKDLVKRFLASIHHALNGIKIGLVKELNLKIHLVATIIVIGAGFILKISTTEWMILVLCIGFVFSAELLNTAVELIADFISPAQHPDIGKIKDIAAGAVLIAAIVSVIVGILIFWPYLKMYFTISVYTE